MSVVQYCVPFSSGDSALCWLEQLSTEKILHIATTTKKQATKHSHTHSRTHAHTSARTHKEKHGCLCYRISMLFQSSCDTAASSQLN